MITEHDLQEAIAECEGQRNPNASTCIKLAAFYTIREHMFGDSEMPSEAFYDKGGYSYAEAPKSAGEEPVEPHSDTLFMQAVDGMTWNELLDVMDELMSTLEIVQPRLYDSVLRKIKER